MAKILINLDSIETGEVLSSYINPQEGNQDVTLAGIANIIDAVMGGRYDLTTGELVVGVSAIGYVNFTGAPSNDNTVTINGVVFTAKTSGATGDQFNIGSQPSDSVANLVAAVNDSTSNGIKDVITAEASGNSVALVANIPGKAGLGYTLIDNLANATVTAFTLPSAETSRTDF